MDDVTTFRLDGDTVVQINADGSTAEFDPRRWGMFRRGSLVVHASRVPRAFKIGADLCTDGYVVWEPGRLVPISTRTFGTDYRAMALAEAA